MDHDQQAIESLQAEIKSVSATIDKAIRDRRSISKDSPLLADSNAAVAAARQALAAVELRLRSVYERKSDD
jgi:hypothetical protein